MPIRAFLVVLCLAGLGFAPATASNDKKRADQAAATAAMRRGEILPITRILALSTRQVAGQVVEVELERKDWGFLYEVKILAANGRMRKVKLNARTGALLEVEGD